MARYDAEHKTRTRRRIIETASERLKLDGIDGAGIATLMSDAGLTNGAFYAHFQSKDDLVATVVADQLSAQRDLLAALPPGRDVIEEYVHEYLSPQHRDHPATGCPTAALLDEISRCGTEVRESYTRGLQSIVDVIAERLSPRDPAASRTTALGVFTLLVGTLQLARAVPDRALSDDILAAGIVNARVILGG